ncbi:MAG: beta-phosphoglucomutase family hydrolase [Bacteroidota bacterium]
MLTNKYKAFLFDLNGTLINDMHYHVAAWHTIVNEMGAGITIEQMKAECYGKNQEVLERIFPTRFMEDEKMRMGQRKEAQYRKDFEPMLKLLPGLTQFLSASDAGGIKMAIGSAAIVPNIDFVLDGTNVRKYFTAIVSADDVVQSKPHPETFLKCAAQLNVLPAGCLVFEDTPKGVECAANAGMDCVVITTMHQPQEFERYKNVIGFVNDYNHQLLTSLL